MSTAKSFAPSTPLSNEERLDTLERKIGVIIDKVSNCERVLAEFSSVLNDLDCLKNAHVTLSKSLNNFSQVTTSSLQDIKNSMKVTVGSLISEQTDLSNKHDVLLNNVKQNDSAIRNSFSSLRDVVDSKTDRTDTLAHASRLSQIESQLGVMDQQVKNVRPDEIYSRLTQHDKILSEYRSNVASLIENVNSTLQTNDLTLNAHKALKQDLESFKSKIPSLLDGCLDKYLRHMGSEIDKAKAEIITSPSSIESLNKGISHRLDSVMLDASNAMLKASNSSQQITILEKKFEAILLNLKKLELTK